jgi:glycosyltransferase involved in cell wall biosynthesis
MNGDLWFALLGKQDTPVDGVDDYCTFLAKALARRGVELKKVRVPWFERGRFSALVHLWRGREMWRGHWILVQYTALSWSRRGFPFYALAIVALLRQGGARCAIVFHEPQGVADSEKLVSRIRRAFQNWVARRLHASSSRSLFADRLETIPWIKTNDPKAAFIPIGANIPEPSVKFEDSTRGNGRQRSVGIFCLSDEPNLLLELNDVAVAAGKAAQNGSKVRVVFMGRGSTQAEPHIARLFRDVPVEISNLGIVAAENISDTLAGCDAMLCVRGKIYPNRGSAIAGIACGMPIVGYAGGAEGTPLAKAGLVLVPFRDSEALGEALVRVLNDPVYSRELREKSLRAQQTYFSWDVIADSFIRLLCEPQNDA